MTYRKRSAALALLAWLALPARAATADDQDKQAKSADDEEVFQLGEGIVPPRVIHQVSPRYVPASRGVRVVGTVVVGLIVTSRGMPKNVHVIQHLDKEVDQSAIDAVQEWRFDPARKSDKPVAVKIAVEVGHFRKDVDPAQFAFEVYGIVLGHHFVRRVRQDPKADRRAHVAFDRLVQAAHP